jgi:hypothetical protein
MAATTTITRFEAIPFGNPQNYAVGFTIRAENGREAYLEGLVPLSDAAGKVDQQIAEIAYNKVKSDAERFIAEVRGQSALVGQVFETEEMRAEREAEEREAAALVAAEAPQIHSSEEAPADGQEDEAFPGGRRTEEETSGTAERDSNAGSSESSPRRRRRAS